MFVVYGDMTAGIRVNDSFARSRIYFECCEAVIAIDRQYALSDSVLAEF